MKSKILLIALVIIAAISLLLWSVSKNREAGEKNDDTPIINSTSTDFLLSRHENELSGETNLTVYDCADNKMFMARVEVKPTELGKAEIFLTDGTKMLLKQTISASGIRYANSGESFIFWSKGDTAFIEEGPVTSYRECVAR